MYDMKSVELKKLKRADLLEILIAQGKEIERLEKELEEAREELNNRIISIENIGSMAEAAFKLNHVFEAADAAAKQYLENIRERCLKDDNLFEEKLVIFDDSNNNIEKKTKNETNKSTEKKKTKTAKKDSPKKGSKMSLGAQ